MLLFGALLNAQWRWNMTDETCRPRYYRSRHADIGWPRFRILTPEKYSTFDHLSSIFNTICATQTPFKFISSDTELNPASNTTDPRLNPSS